MIEEKSMQSMGGEARKKALTPEQRSEMSRNAAEARWAMAPIDPNKPRVPKATHESNDLKLGDMVIPCAVLENGTRVLSERGVTKALGGKRGGAHWRRIKEGGANLPVYLSADNFKPFISNGLQVALMNPILYKSKNGGLAYGLPAALLPEVCEVFLKARDTTRGLHPSQKHLAIKADILMRALAHVGIIALVDEATGYQDVRDRQALQEILKKYISGALLAYASMFPMVFYKELFRLKGWPWNNGKMPSVVGHYTNDLVYHRLAPGVLEELRRKNPVTESGHRKNKHFQWLTKEIGHPALNQILYRLIGMMEASPTWEAFKIKVDTKLPRWDRTPLLEFGDDSKA
jgi:hypothetical protein